MNPFELGGSSAEKGEAKVRLIKILSLAAVTAFAAMAFMGASSAMAEDTVLCTVDSELKCPEADQAKHVHFLSTEPGLLLSSAINILCKYVLYLGDALGLGKPQVIHGKFSYIECHSFSGSTNCSVSETSSSSLLLVLKLKSEEAEVTGHGEVLVECGAFIHCKYKGEGLKGHGLGELLGGEVSIEEQTVKKVSGFFCPETSKLHLTMASLEDEPIYIRS
jgi:hypothetical protein